MGPRVAYVCADPGVPAFGTKGASVHVQEIIRAWRARGAQVRLYCVRTDEHIPADLADIPVTRIAVPGGDPAAREIAQQEASRLLADRIVADGVDVVYERYSLFSTTLAQVVAATGVPGVLEVNAPLIDEQAEHRDLVDADGAHEALRTQVRAADSIACVSAPVAAWVRERVPDLAEPVRISVVPNGVNTERIQVVRADREPEPGEPAVVTFVGTLKPWHGTEVLIEALSRRMENWTVRIVGDGPQRAALQEQAATARVPVEFLGAVVPEQIPAALAGSSIAVAPYPKLGSGAADDQAQYFSPLKVFEYAAAGLPIVASAVGQLPKIIRHGRTGLLVPPSDPVALAQAIDSLVADRLWAATMGDAARAQVVRERSWPVVLDASLRTLRGPWLEQVTGAHEAGTANPDRIRAAGAA